MFTVGRMLLAAALISVGDSAVAQATRVRGAIESVGGNDVTSTLPSLGVQLGTDLSGDFTKPMFVVGGGVAYPIWQQIIIDAQFRFGRIMVGEPELSGINVSRAGIGLGVKF